eukprot:6192268-Pleurochrysis_carterae.AAC.3
MAARMRVTPAGRFSMCSLDGFRSRGELKLGHHNTISFPNFLRGRRNRAQSPTVVGAALSIFDG